MYHRIAPRRSNRTFPTSNVTPSKFEEQLTGLLERGFVATPLRQLISWNLENVSPDRKAFSVTFDDGYANNFLFALPILKKLHIPATIFVSTAYLDSSSPFPFDNWRDARNDRAAPEDWRALTSDECKALLDTGIIELGAHTHRHLDFRGSPEVFEADLRENIQVLRERFRVRDISFAFPYGKQKKGFSGPVLVEAARRTGVTCGLTSENKTANIQTDPFSWGRWTASEYDSSSTLSAKLDGRYQTLKDRVTILKSLLHTFGKPKNHKPAVS